MNTHINIVGIIHLIFGGLGLLAGIGVTLMVVLLGGIGGVAAMADSASTAGEALAVFASLGIIGAVIGGLVALISLPQMIAGYGLLRRRAWAPMIALVVSAFQLLNFPFGTVLGLYSAWALLSSEGQRVYKLGGASYGRLN